MLVVSEDLFLLLTAPSLLGLPWSGCVGETIGRLVPPQSALLSAFPQSSITVEEGYGSASEGDMMASCTLRANG